MIGSTALTGKNRGEKEEKEEEEKKKGEQETSTDGTVSFLV